jgi:2-amino-4-hydroxy-6-hydroxymethyldihydropteridine diphosphokinase
VSATARAPIRVFVGLGANLDDPVAQIGSALAELAQLPQTRLVAASPLYRTPPLGPPDQPDYVNAVAELATTLTPHTLLDELQRIERAHRRVRAERWGPRTLDLDLLLYGATMIADERLSVPHPGLATRAFVLLPLADLAPELQVPGMRRVRELADAADRTGITRL